MKSLRIALTLTALIALLTTTNAQRWGTVKGEGPVVTKELQVDAFKAVGLAVVGEIYLSKGPQKVTVKGQANIIDLLETDVEDGEWSIELERKARNYEKLIFEISVPNIEGLSIAGSGSIKGRDAFEGLRKMDMSIAGSGDISFSGSADKVSISIAGSGRVAGGDLRTKEAEVDIAGSGDCQIDAVEELEVSIAGSGDVKYKGNPRLNTSVAGSGKVRKM